MSIRVIAIGKKHESWVDDGILRYQNRLRKPYDLKWVLIPHSELSNDAARREESERILSHIGRDDFLILLDERGVNIDSIALSKLLETNINISKPITIVIGGAYGVDPTIHERANYVWSLSKLVFPHQLVRLILVEQLYRSQEISNNHPYHHV